MRRIPVWIQWLAANVIAETVLLLAVAAFGPWAGVLHGALFGTSQWWVLRSRFERAWHWIPTSVIGGWLGIIAGIPFFMIAPPPFGLDDNGPIWNAVLPGIVGGVMGAVQWSVLRRRISHTGWWIPAQATGMIVTYLLEPRTFDGVRDGSVSIARIVWLPDPFIGAVVGGLLAGLAYGVITGLVVVRPPGDAPSIEWREG